MLFEGVSWESLCTRESLITEIDSSNKVSLFRANGFAEEES